MNSTAPQILVVDDEPDTCANLRDILGEHGYRVDTALSGPSALELVQKNPYDVALLDLKMPGMDGLELYRRIKALRAGTVAIIVTAYASGETARSALAAGAWRIVSKPVDSSQLMQLVQQALKQPLVMIVDDDHDLCEALWGLLREQGYRVCVAHDLVQTKSLLDGHSFQVVLIDMKLQEADGREVFELVRKTDPDCRTILVTGYRSEMDSAIRQVLDEGANEVCYKPFDMDRLLATIERLTKGA